MYLRNTLAIGGAMCYNKVGDVFMKRLCAVLLGTSIFSALATQLTIFIFGKLDFVPRGSASFYPMLFALTMTAAVLAVLNIGKEPRYPAVKLSRIAEREGYSDRYFAELRRWCEKCEKKKCGETAALVMSETLAESGRLNEAFAQLRGIKFSELTRRQRQVYYNTWLYAAVLCEDISAADEIYRSGRGYLVSVTSRSLAASVKHTLGCYRYLRGELPAAEEQFFQSIESARGSILCEDYLALSACYLDTERLPQAKSAVEKAAEYADGSRLEHKVANARELVEQAYSQYIADHGERSA